MGGAIEPHSYGYRPGRGTHDALAAIVLALDHRPSFVFVADIEGAFDHLNQTVVLDKLQTYPALREAINAWLKAGIKDRGSYFPSVTGIPQGGALSPLLLNVALHGMETVVKDSNASMSAAETPLMIRYADDFLVFHSNLDELQKTVTRVTNWLQEVGLRLNSRKTHITHTLSSYQGHLGFDFLGFAIRQYPPEKTEPDPLLPCKTVITPSSEASHHHLAAIAERLDQLRTASQAQVIQELNPIISGWAMYYSRFVSAHSLSKYDELVRQLLLNWARKHHPNKEIQELNSRYWHPVEEGVGSFLPQKAPSFARTAKPMSKEKPILTMRALGHEGKLSRFFPCCSKLMNSCERRSSGILKHGRSQNQTFVSSCFTSPCKSSAFLLYSL